MTLMIFMKFSNTEKKKKYQLKRTLHKQIIFK